MDPTPNPALLDLATQLPVVRRGRWLGQAYLPLEYWRRSEAWPLFRGAAAERLFRSSGTTGAPRSTSRFSSAGLAAYKAQSVAYFLDVLSQVLPLAATGAGPLAAVRGISLVPPVTIWPDSSLAQMVAWIGEVLPLTYATEETLAELITAHPEQPVWFFGTAFHLLNAIDSGCARPLPSGSVIIETGGTKGKAREVTRSELYADLEAAFKVRQTAIISEYGMCELACQAYDYVPRGEERSLELRRFHFPPWVQLAVLTAPAKTAEVGTGALMVYDPLRLDAPWPVRTEDLAELNGRSFKLLGRAPSQPLKGCSLQVDELRLSRPLSTNNAAPTRLTPYDQDGAARRAARLGPMLLAFTTSREAEAGLTTELGSTAAALAALDDLRAGLPTTAEAWTRAAGRACDQQPVPADWLFILPANHSVVGLYPLALAYLLGLRVTVRLPHRFAASANLLTDFIARLNELPEAEVSTAPPTLRLTNSSPVPQYGAILAYGSDATMTLLRRQTQVPLQGFGGRVGISLLRANDLATCAEPLARDLLSLGQTGCMATRLVLVEDPLGLNEAERTAWALELAAACRDFWQAELPQRDQVGLDFEACRLQGAGAQILLPDDLRTPLLAIRSIGPHEQVTPSLIDAMIARAPFTVPLLWLPNRAAIDAVLSQLEGLQSLGQVTASTAVLQTLPSILANPHHGGDQLRVLGFGNRQVWHGSHENRPLFAGFAANFL